MQGIKKPGFAGVIGIYRQVAPPMLLFWLLAVGVGLGVVGVWIGILVVTWSAAIIALIYARKKLSWQQFRK